MQHKRLTLFAGHYGSGKTNLALNWARWLKDRGERVTVADLDIVNPYFRTKDAAEELAAAGIGLISSEYANSNVDLPAMPKEIYGLVAARDVCGVLDIGGDDRGALALGRYAASIREEDDYEMLLVVNFARPLTRTAEDALTVLREIEEAGGLPFTAIVNNTNLGGATTAEDVLGSVPLVRELSERTGLPVKLTGVERRLLPALSGKVDDLFPIKILELYYMEKEGTSIGKINLSGRTL